ncbi:MAG TPA: ribosome biogenesis GTPase Der [Acidimicrobiales bacterium]|jgi:GTP-binding protein|nr:ribosome biogenesis GTPase Der [Acidimicrobiales bacterium]
MPDQRVPVVAIVGRPNVGKSTLMNRVVGRREAIVEERPGVTRDRKEVEAEWNGRDFVLVDTGGWLPGGDHLDAKVSQQSERAVLDADVVLFVVDASIGVTEEDDRAASMVRRSGKRVLLLVNKVDDTNREPLIWDFVRLGLGEPVAVSALHGRGTGDALDALVALLPAPVEAPEPAADGEAARRARDVLSVALVGRPNVGKSTLFNRLIGDERSVVHDMPGTTRDTIDTVIETPGGPLRFVDTAGMRRRSRIDQGTEYFSLVRALQAVDSADVALLLIDATEGVTHQDQRLAERVEGAGCPVIVVLNKWELLDAEARALVQADVERKLAFLGRAVVVKTSALSGKGVHKVLPALSGVVDEYRRRIPTRQVNEVITLAQQAHPAPGGARVLYATQGATDPPTFTLFANRELPRTYLRFLENRIRDAFDLGQTPIKLRVRKRTD